jgi:hypothetical protein
MRIILLKIPFVLSFISVLNLFGANYFLNFYLFFINKPLKIILIKNHLFLKFLLSIKWPFSYCILLYQNYRLIYPMRFSSHFH